MEIECDESTVKGMEGSKEKGRKEGKDTFSRIVSSIGVFDVGVVCVEAILVRGSWSCETSGLGEKRRERSRPGVLERRSIEVGRWVG